MRFDPPLMSNIEEVLPHIEGNSAFIVRDKGWYTVIDYVYNSPDTFTNAYQRECRGLKFCSETGRLLARPYHKFFNMDEREETQLKNLEFSNPHTILEKHDGSMIHTCPFTKGDDLRFMTRMGETEVAEKAAAFVRNNPQISDSIHKLQEQFYNCTLIFEYVGPQNRIVCYYDKEELILTGIRVNMTGHYVPYSVMIIAAANLKIPYVKKAYVDFDRERIASDPYNEGVVVRFETGGMVKVKAEAYVRKHRSKEQISTNKGLITAFIHNDLDDIIPQLDDKLKKCIKEYTAELDKQIKVWADSLKNFVEISNEAGLDRKNFALSIREQNPIVKPMLFNVHSGDDPTQVVLNSFKKNCTSNTRLSNLMAGLGIKEWDGYFFENE